MNPLNTPGWLYPHIFPLRRGKKERASTHSCLSLGEGIAVDTEFSETQQILTAEH